MSHRVDNFEGTVVDVPLGERSYPIYIGHDVMTTLGEAFVEHCGRRRAIIITDENVAPLYAEKCMASLQAAGAESHLLSVAPGEASKSQAVVDRLYGELFDLAAERQDVVVALGGGVVGDLAGFVAASFKRGLPFVQVPTTLLAMVDSSIGGKTGINHPRGKNMIGAFHQPKLVFADTATLATLPRRELGCGLAETVKHAVIRDAEFFDYLEQNAARLDDLEPRLLIELVARNCRIKADVVANDEREGGLRGILNLGHTVGHTLETVLEGKPYHHGEAVALGTVAACRLAMGHGLLTDEQCARIIALLKLLGLPVVMPSAPPTDALYTAMLQDKKVTAGKIKFVLPTGLGSCTFVTDLSEADIKAAIDSLAAE